MTEQVREGWIDDHGCVQVDLQLIQVDDLYISGESAAEQIEEEQWSDYFNRKR